MTTYPNTAAGYAQAIADHGESNLLVDPFARTITVKPDDTAPADRYVTAEQFRDRFTGAEMAAILAAQQTDAQSRSFCTSLLPPLTGFRSMTLALSLDCRTSSVRA